MCGACTCCAREVLSRVCVHAHMVPQSHAASKDAPVGMGRVVVAVENNLKGSTCLRTEDLRRLFVFWERRQRNERGEKERTKNGKREKNKCRQTGVQGNERKSTSVSEEKLNPLPTNIERDGDSVPPRRVRRLWGLLEYPPQIGATQPRSEKRNPVCR